MANPLLAVMSLAAMLPPPPTMGSVRVRHRSRPATDEELKDRKARRKRQKAARRRNRA